MNKKLYMPINLGAGLLGRALAGVIFKRVWRLTVGDDDIPEATEAGRTWFEVIVAGAIQGAIVGVIRAIVDRGAVAGIARITGTWPGEDDQDHDQPRQLETEGQR